MVNVRDLVSFEKIRLLRAGMREGGREGGSVLPDVSVQQSLAQLGNH